MNKELLAFSQWVNSDTEDLQFSEPELRAYADGHLQSFAKQFGKKEDGGDKLRVSSLGKPAVLQALSVLGFKETGKVSKKLRHIFYTGDVFETYLFTLARKYGFDVIMDQAEVDFYDVKGHIDGVFRNPTNDQCFAVELKTMSPNYHKKFQSKQDDERGYLTQAAVYSDCLGLPIYWLTLNKGTHEITCVEPDSERLSEALERAKRIIPRLKSVASLEDVLTLFKAPPAVPEVYRKKETGRWLLPESMKWSSFAPAFYDITEDVNGYGNVVNYVTGYKDVPNFVDTMVNGTHHVLDYDVD